LIYVCKLSFQNNSHIQAMQSYWSIISPTYWQKRVKTILYRCFARDLVQRRLFELT